MTPLLWVVKTADSKSLSHSEKREQLQIFSQAQRASRRQKAATRHVAAPNGDGMRLGNPCKQQVSGTKGIPCGYREDDLSLDEEQTLPFLSRVLKRDSQWTTAERRSATYFQEVSVYKILTLQRDIDFWKGVVPCLAELYPSIRHLIVAIGATFELLFLPESSSLNEFALKQCNKALRSILSGRDMDPSYLTASCILVSAYSLLRSDLEAADNSIESGLKMITQTVVLNPQMQQLSRILISLSKQHGFKLWAPDITFQFDKTVAGRERLVIDSPFLDYPFLVVEQVLNVFKVTMVDHVAKIMRNLTLGAHVDPDCLWARDMTENYARILHHWEALYNNLSTDCAEEKLQLMQLKIGILLAYLLFNTRMIESNETKVDAYEKEYAEIVRLGQEVINARHAGKPVIYLDRIVNGALYTSTTMCRDPLMRRKLIGLLKSQAVYTDGLVNHLRGRVAEAMTEVEEGGAIVRSCYDIPENRRTRTSSLHCREDRVLCMQYMMASDTDRLYSKQHFARLGPELDQFNVQEIDNCLKGMTSAYKMYMKLDMHTAPNGYLREMYYGGEPVPVVWRADLANS